MLRIAGSRLISQRFLSSVVNQPSTATPQPDKLFRQIELEVRGHDRAVLQSYMTFVHVSFYISIWNQIEIISECLRAFGCRVYTYREPSLCEMGPMASEIQVRPQEIQVALRNQDSYQEMLSAECHWKYGKYLVGIPTTPSAWRSRNENHIWRTLSVPWSCTTENASALDD